jgi:diguanylate cyclase (GGDEF)-like protein
VTLLPAGILLPEDILNTTWFQVFAGFVAFNTIVYMGLTLSKMVVWPRQARLRAMATRLPGSARVNGTAPPTADAVPEAETRDLRHALIRHDVPLGLAWLGGLLIVLNALVVLLEGGGSVAVHVVGVTLGVVMLAAAQVLVRTPAGVRALSIAWALAVAAIAAFAASPVVAEHDTLGMVFVLVLQASFAFALVSWRPFIATGVLTLAAVIVGVFVNDLPQPLGWVALSLAALVVGALVMRSRLAGIEAMEEAQRLTQRLATTDPLTGLLSHAGMESILPRFVGTARRSGESICAMYVAIPDLDRATRDYGRDYGNAVLGAVADAVRSTVRDGDLVSRWHANGFLVMGFGMQPDPGMLARRVQDQVSATGVDLGKWPIEVTAGTAAGSPEEDGAMPLIAAAEHGASA